MSREVAEWIGKSDDSKAPPRIRLRVFEKWEGRCYLSGRKIMPGDLWDLDHIIALINGGENRESNLAPVLRDKHREKTRQDVAEKAKVYERRASHLGVKKSTNPMPGSRNSPWKRKMNGQVVRREP